MKVIVLLLLVCGCSPLGAYTHSLSYGKELFGKDQVAETYKRFADLERAEAGYPPTRDGVFPYRNATPRK